MQEVKANLQPDQTKANTNKAIYHNKQTKPEN
jgi:hypothetical protein